MKAFYGLYNKNLFQIHSTPNVKSICDFPLNNVSTELKPCEKELGINIVMSNISPSGSKNAKLVNDAIQVIQENKLTKIDNLVNRYRVAIDYVILNDDKIPVDQGINYKEISVEDMVIPFDVNSDNVYEFSIGKKFTGSFNFMYRSATPFGIMCARENKYHILINRIMLLQARTLDTDAMFDDRSMSGVSHNFYLTHEDINDKFLIIYDTMNEGFSFDPISISFKPREINVNLNIQLGDYFSVADETTITNELKKNEPSEPSVPVDTVTGDENNEDSSSSVDDVDPDGDGKFTKFSRCEQNDEGAKIIVSDDISEEEYDPDTMYKQSEVRPYITDIQVGEYVVLNTYTIV